MADLPLKPNDLETLKQCYRQIDEISKRNKLSKRGEICTWHPYCDDKIVVEADGFGGATLMRVSDHYPFDGFDLKDSHVFGSEDEASAAAEWFDEHSEVDASEFFKDLADGKKPWLEDEAPAESSSS